MKKIKLLLKGFTVALLLSVYGFSASAQNNAIGIRLGGLTSGLTYKHYFANDNGLEVLLGFAYKGIIFTGLYEKHKDIASAEGLKWYFGGGAHFGSFRAGGSYFIYKDHGKHITYYEYENGFATFGADMIIGMEYKFNGAPINVSLDIKPIIEFTGYEGLYFDGGLSFRFVF